MTRYYAWRNQIARSKLTKAQTKIQALKEENDQANIGILAQASLQALKTHEAHFHQIWDNFDKFWFFANFER